MLRALHMAARYGLVAVTRRLLEKGASVHIVDSDGLTPALACAPSPAIAQCLSLILATTSQPQPQNSKSNNTVLLQILTLFLKWSLLCNGIVMANTLCADFKKYTMSLPLLNPSMSYPSDCSLLRTAYSHSSDSDFYWAVGSATNCANTRCSQKLPTPEPCLHSKCLPATASHATLTAQCSLRSGIIVLETLLYFIYHYLLSISYLIV